MVAQNKIFLDQVVIERSNIEETGEYDLEGLFVRLGFAIDSVGAKRIVLDTIEALFAGLSNAGIVRSELRRLFRWLKDKGVTAVITAEQGQQGELTRYGLEEYVSDCVILLDNRVKDELSTRRMRIIKYRGSKHGTNEYPFVIDERGFSVLPVTSLSLEHAVSTERVSTGIAGLDEMMDGKGYFKGSSILLVGMAGTGKTSVAAHFVDAACRRGQRCLYFASEESPQQIIRNMRSISIDLENHIKRGLLHIQAARPSMQGLEIHLVTMQRATNEFKPDIVVVDALTDYISMGSAHDVRTMALRLVDFFKSSQITALFTALIAAHNEPTDMAVGISSASDVWIRLTNVESNLESNRVITLVKSRGMPHSNQMREFSITNKGVVLLDIPVTGTGEMLLGSARIARQEQEKAEALRRQQEAEAKQRTLDQKRKALESQVESLKAAFDVEAEEINTDISKEKQRAKALANGVKRLQEKRTARSTYGCLHTQTNPGIWCNSMGVCTNVRSTLTLIPIRLRRVPTEWVWRELDWGVLHHSR
ncbi:MAG: circadian clock protein KaiC [Chloroflexi bacterium]|nr:circadian clock protein KaiC [Chloroflexota bacterium]